MGKNRAHPGFISHTKIERKTDFYIIFFNDIYAERTSRIKICVLQEKKYDLICKSFKKYIPAFLLYCYYVLYFIFNLRKESYIIASSFI